MIELYACQNRIASIDVLLWLINMEILDLSYNNITNFEEIVHIADLKYLRIVNFYENKITHSKSYQQVTLDFHEKMDIEFDLENIEDFSCFANCGFLLFSDKNIGEISVTSGI